MTEQYDSIASQFHTFRAFSPLRHIETYTYFQLLGNIQGKTVLDLGCGEGFYTRQLRAGGASRVVGMDISAGMLAEARAQERQHPLGIEYCLGNASEFELAEKFDLIVAAYLLNHARSPTELLAICQRIHAHLNPKGYFFTVNHNLDLPIAVYPKLEKYGIQKHIEGELRAGTPINVRLTINEQGETLSLQDVYLSRSTYEWAFDTAGFQPPQWYTPRVSPEGIETYGQAFWQDFLDYPHMLYIRCAP